MLYSFFPQSSDVKLLSVQLGCEKETCPHTVHLHIHNPSGDVDLSFSTRQVKQIPPKPDDLEANGMTCIQQNFDAYFVLQTIKTFSA